MRVGYGDVEKQPVVGDWDGNGTFTPGVVDAEGDVRDWYLANSLSGGEHDVHVGYGDVRKSPIVGDWNGDRVFTPGVVDFTGDHRDWHLTNRLDDPATEVRVAFGGVDATPVTGDWDGDGYFTPAWPTPPPAGGTCRTRWPAVSPTPCSPTRACPHRRCWSPRRGRATARPRPCAPRRAARRPSPARPRRPVPCRPARCRCPARPPPRHPPPRSLPRPVPRRSTSRPSCTEEPHVNRLRTIRRAGLLAALALSLAVPAGAAPPGPLGPDRKPITDGWAGAGTPSSLAPPATARGLAAAGAPSGYPITGIDVSHHQGKIDWEEVADKGARFVYAKVTEGVHYVDASFKDNYSGARKNGILFGAYHFARPEKSSGRTQADYFLDRAQYRNDGRTLPPMLDIEWPYRMGGKYVAPSPAGASPRASWCASSATSPGGCSSAPAARR
ncbi:glycoside hydrolase family 25 protein [Catellatospora bangladeshensis]|uniref:glycoside hydrolase family 25 protein n=1 Tax=Catellatospora bangladeshensis TaxID=310355 RepID=UPI003616701E